MSDAHDANVLPPLHFDFEQAQMFANTLYGMADATYDGTDGTLYAAAGLIEALLARSVTPGEAQTVYYWSVTERIQGYGIHPVEEPLADRMQKIAGLS
jgi:hypothetical protein